MKMLLSARDVIAENLSKCTDEDKKAKLLIAQRNVILSIISKTNLLTKKSKCARFTAKFLPESSLLDFAKDCRQMASDLILIYLSNSDYPRNKEIFEFYVAASIAYKRLKDTKNLEMCLEQAGAIQMLHLPPEFIN